MPFKDCNHCGYQAYYPTRFSYCRRCGQLILPSRRQWKLILCGLLLITFLAVVRCAVANTASLIVVDAPAQRARNHCPENQCLK
ncbi:MAG: hypothetical protein U0Y68_27170 [Blastocatellia bacterium]